MQPATERFLPVFHLIIYIENVIQCDLLSVSGASTISSPQHAKSHNYQPRSRQSSPGGSSDASAGHQQEPLAQSGGVAMTSVTASNKPRGKGRPTKIAGSVAKQGVYCPVCGKIFNNSSALAKHKLTHSDERKYVCMVCAKAFKRQDHL